MPGKQFLIWGEVRKMSRRNDNNTAIFVYWMAKSDLDSLKSVLPAGFKLKPAMLTPCETMKCHENVIYYASPAIWSRICVRQGSWYRSSEKNGRYMVVSGKELPGDFEAFFEVKLTQSDFVPASLPTQVELQELTESEEYISKKPGQWENKGIKDSVMFNILFTLTGFWGVGDNLKKYWLSQRANHANYLTHRFSTEIDGKEVPYSVAENAGICSSCVEFFNVIDESSRKLVRACPGAVTFGKAKRNIYYDVNPSK
jgi:hypothetical protein